MGSDRELRQVLLAHGAKYPLMEPGDAVKLIYQNEFGGGHLVRDREAFLNYLRREYASVAGTPCRTVREDIGNGLCRVYLNGLTPPQVEELGLAFLRSAQLHRGSMEGFLKKVENLRQVASEKAFAFTMEELDAYLLEYRQAGCPMVSHSDRYRAAYRPAYRIVRWAELGGGSEDG